MGIQYTVEMIEESRGKDNETWIVRDDKGEGAFLVNDEEEGKALITALDGYDLNQERTLKEEEDLILKLADAAPGAGTRSDDRVIALGAIAGGIAMKRMIAGLSSLFGPGIFVGPDEEGDEYADEDFSDDPAEGDQQPSDQVSFAKSSAD